MLEVCCEEHLKSVRAHADTLGEAVRAQFEEKLAYLETYAGGDCKCELFKDFAPHSFAFNMLRKRQGSDEWERWFNGGLVMHAPRSTGVGFPEMSVVLNPEDQTHWGIHT